VTDHSDVIARALSRLLMPLARILVRHGVAFGAFSEVARRAYVRAAEGEARASGRRPTAARTAMLTGLSRKEVSRLRRQQGADAADAGDASLNRAARVIAGWVRDTDFHDAEGEPAALRLDGPRGFHALVHRYAGDMPAQTVLEELERAGAVSRGADAVQLVERSYVPGADTAQKLQMLGTDTRDLIATIDHNLSQAGDDARFQRKAVYDNVPEEFVGAFRERVRDRGQAFLEDFDHWLADRDRDHTPGVGGSGRVRLGVAVYLIEDRGAGHEEDDETQEQDA
jgi:hypothetical protein